MQTKRIFLASSAELAEDRKEFEVLISRKNKDWVKRGVFLELVMWEDFLDVMSQTRLQNEYNRVIRDCDIFVMLFWTKVGKYTQEEFSTAFAEFKATQRPFILTYFKDAPINTGSANRANLNSLWEFQERLNELGHFQTVYKNIDALKLHFSQQLDKLVANGFVEFDSMSARAAAEQANLTGSGAIAQGSNNVAVGRGGVSIGGHNSGTINTGTLIHGDLVRGDKVLGSKIGSQINTGGGAYIAGNVSATGNFVGRDMYQYGGAGGELEAAFAQLRSAVAGLAALDRREQALRQVEDLKSEAANGKRADDGRLARMVDALVGLVPGAVGTVVSTFAAPSLNGITGPVTQFVLEKLQRK